MTRPVPPAEHVSRTPAGQYQPAVKAALDAVRAGEVFQVQIGQRFETDTDADALDVYRVLRTLNPSPYMYLLRLDGFDIVGSQPGGAGHRDRRPGGAAPDRRHPPARRHPGAGRRAGRRAGLATPRSGPSTSCSSTWPATTSAGSARRGPCGWSSSARWSATPTSGTSSPPSPARSRAGRDALDVLTACFPAGTLTGAPKVRAMEIIDELEPVRRGVYGGAVGYLDAAGDLDMAIAIRTAVIRDGTRTCRRRPASSPTATRPPRSRRPATRPAPCCRRSPPPPPSLRRRSRERRPSPPTAAAPPGSSPGVVAVCAVGGGMVLFAVGQTWVEVVARRPSPLPDVTLALSGRSLEPLVAGLGMVGLAGVVGLLATRRWGRLVVAAIVALSGLGVLVTALSRLAAPERRRGRRPARRRRPVRRRRRGHRDRAPGLAAAGRRRRPAARPRRPGRAAPAGAGRRCRPGTRRRPPAPTAPRTDARLWDALDRGDDPTAEPLTRRRLTFARTRR